MLQIMGWLFCVALFCWGVSMFGNSNYQIEDADGKRKMTEAGNMAGVVAIIAACGFAFWFYAQGMPVADAYSYGSETSIGDQMARDAMSSAEVEAAAAEAIAGAEAAAAAADKAAAGY